MTADNKPSEAVNDALRAAAAAALPATSREVSDMLRQAAGRESAAARPPAAAPSQPDPTDARVRAVIAADAGLSPEMGERLRGSAVEELAADARDLAATVEQARAAEWAVSGGGLDGGARGGGRSEPQGPSADAVIRATWERQQAGLMGRAREIDRIRNTRR